MHSLTTKDVIDLPAYQLKDIICFSFYSLQSYVLCLVFLCFYIVLFYSAALCVLNDDGDDDDDDDEDDDDFYNLNRSPVHSLRIPKFN